MSLTTDPKDPRLGHGADTAPGPQNEVYLVLSEAERAKGFARPVRHAYRHAGIAGPQHPLRDLTGQEQERYGGTGYVKFEEYPEGSTALGRFWTQAQLDSIDGGCGTITTMGQELAETYARDFSFYGATFCCGCRLHRPVGRAGEFTWMTPGGQDTDERVGT